MSSELPSTAIRIGVQFVSADPFWVMVREGIHRRAEDTGITLVPLEIDLWPLHGEQQMQTIEELLAMELHGLVAQGMGVTLARLVADAGTPTVLLSETNVTHPKIASPFGLHEVARIAANFVAERIDGRGRVLMIGGLQEGFDKGQSRISGFRDGLARFPDIEIDHIPTSWLHQRAFERVAEALSSQPRTYQAIFGLSDSIALAGLEAARRLGIVTDKTVIVGINGDPLALAAILDGSMTATVETRSVEFGARAVDLVVQAAQGEALPMHFGYRPRLITRENVAQVSVEKLAAIAGLPGRLVGINRHMEQERLTQLETSLEISRRIGSILDRTALYIEIVGLIRANYGYDEAQIFMWSLEQQEFVLDKLGGEDKETIRIPLAESGLLGYTFLRNQLTFVPEMRHSHRFPPDPYWPATRSRVIVPINQRSTTIGLLDLHSRQPIQHSSAALIGLQALANQMGAALHNCELFSQAVEARAEAERANQLKSRLLANVSHEFRTPLNVIEGYSQSALTVPDLYGFDLPPALKKDLHHIYASAEHLEWLINDLLDVSRAEIGELEIFPEPLDPRTVVEETFEIMAGSSVAQPTVTWRLELPESLPQLHADRARLRQIFLNLLSNAGKFTSAGHITLGAGVQADSVHFWIEDTGRGIAPELQQRIFDTFSTADQPAEPGQGIGLGLRVTHELVKAHHGRIWLDSTPGVGTTMHVLLPAYRPEAEDAEPEAPDPFPLPATLPGETGDLPLHISALVRQAVALMREQYDEAITREGIAESLGVSANYFSRVFRRELGMSPWQYLSRLRVLRAKQLLTNTDMSVTEVALAVGFADSAYFSRTFHKEVGRSPLAYRRQVR